MREERIIGAAARHRRHFRRHLIERDDMTCIK
jgi:hypothetical protein